MIDYIELNGERSTDVKGLMVQSLPPITKPKVRTSIEEIDGRDGDIATRLGYAAYDREVGIGLHGDFDIDDAISFFDSEGEAVFSNEREKYYRYRILDRIDFERLVRFRTAKVKLHVQPFKYDAVDRTFEVVNQLIDIRDSSTSRFGVTAASSGGSVRVAGKATGTVEIMVPIDRIVLSGSYELTAVTRGNSAGCALKLVSRANPDGDYFGGTYIELKDNGTSSVTAGADAEYDALWLYAQAGTSLDFTLSVTMASNDFRSITLTNRGNVISRPTVTVYGSDNVGLAINSATVLSLSIDGGYITIDAEEMNAYHGDALMNRRVVGDYADLTLKPGENVISWSGNVTGIRVENFSRWL